MAAKFQYNTEELRQRAVKALRGGTAPSWRALSGVLGVPEATLKYHLQHVLRIGSLAELATSVGAMPDARKMPVYEDPKKADRIDQESDGAALEISSVSVSGQIRTEDELVRACKIDLDERVITAGEHRKWDVTLKLRRGKHEIMRIVPQFYVRLRWLPKHPQPIEPVISPIELAIKLPKPRQTKRVELRRALVLADAQVGFRRRVQTGELTPFHDRRVLDLALQVLQAERFDAVLLIGDCLDMSEWSLKYVAEPEFYWTTQPALIEWAWWLAQYRTAAPSACIDLFEGNHEARQEDVLVAHLKAAYGLRAVDELQLPASMSIERLLALHQLHVNYVTGYPDNKKWLNRNVLVRHGDVVRAAPGDSAKAVVMKTAYTTIFGHTHRRELVSRRIASQDGDVIQTAFSPGCACHIDGRCPGSTSDSQWQQGLAVVEYTDDFEAIVPIPIENGRAIYAGRQLQARERCGEAEDLIRQKLKEIKA